MGFSVPQDTIALCRQVSKPSTPALLAPILTARPLLLRLSASNALRVMLAMLERTLLRSQRSNVLQVIIAQLEQLIQLSSLAHQELTHRQLLTIKCLSALHAHLANIASNARYLLLATVMWVSSAPKEARLRNRFLAQTELTWATQVLWL
jgi:hypothetical protein